MCLKFVEKDVANLAVLAAEPMKRAVKPAHHGYFHSYTELKLFYYSHPTELSFFFFFPTMQLIT